jgi:hypothetical protein
MRAGEEKEAAMNATHPNARRCHMELANAYERRAHDLSAGELCDGLHIRSAA